MGIDQEFIDGYIMLADMMFENLNASEKLRHKVLHRQVRDTLTLYYDNDYEDVADFSTSVYQSKFINHFHKVMSEYAGNKEMVDAFRI